MSLGMAKFSQDAESIRRMLVHLDSRVLSSQAEEQVRVTKAFTLVWISSALETYWRTFLAELCTRIQNAPARQKRKALQVAALFYFDVFGSMGQGKKLPRWFKAVEFFDGLPTLQGSVVPSIPYDGRTLNPEHLNLAWKLFALGGNSFPSPIHRQELNTLATRRNDVAHGNISPQVVGGQVSVADLRKTVQRMEDVVEHCVIAANRRWP